MRAFELYSRRKKDVNDPYYYADASGMRNPTLMHSRDVSGTCMMRNKVSKFDKIDRLVVNIGQ